MASLWQLLATGRQHGIMEHLKELGLAARHGRPHDLRMALAHGESRLVRDDGRFTKGGCFVDGVTEQSARRSLCPCRVDVGDHYDSCLFIRSYRRVSVSR